ncbi:MAG: glycoside hydrolase family 88 protein [Muribaculaceae bacterium]|nr:glycoside hydrolase family 88 protein [Muribaculaceae bacterium]MDE6532448.1 glycoside hydrolase family 88 protein [Muribaculaceae bacterium]MDE6772605.1 glycoside hydrolase family 88 protein [Muribaculaceae bacterium]
MIHSCAEASAEGVVDTDRELGRCHDKVSLALSRLGGDGDSIDYTMMPRNVEGDSKEWHCRKSCAEEWCSGFWPGILWMDYAKTKDPEIRRQAELFTAQIGPILDRPVFDHDLGFLFFCSYGKGYEVTGDESYKSTIIAAADSLATLFNPKVGTLMAWPRNVEMFGGHNTIMDTMINLEMLFWAARNGGDKGLYDMAVRHAETTMEHHFRPDGTCYHVAVYDPESGEFIKGCTHQGYADNSTWARGQSWAIYGYTVVYRETRDPRFLEFAQKVTDAYLSRLPEDYVPYWDFDDPSIPDAPRDASAACVVASALLELSKYVGKEQADRYVGLSRKMLASLSSPAYRSDDDHSSFLLHSTGHHPAGSEIDASIIYADYYYMEALNRLAELNAESKEV